MARAYEAEGWREHVIDFKEPHKPVETLDREVAAVDGALRVLAEVGILPHTRYDMDLMLAHRAAVRDRFDIPWTAITPRAQRLLYAINAIARPDVMVAVGIFCGNTFISNAGAAVGPGACYAAKRLVGIEIREPEADRARRNVATVDPEGRVEILGTDGLAWLEAFEGTIDLLYLDADGTGGRGKSIYLDMLQAALPALRPGSLVLAHNSVNSHEKLKDYLVYVRDPGRFRESVNVIVDDQGLEVTAR
jgi:predicted O-methyltransferase YrrM